MLTHKYLNVKSNQVFLSHVQSHIWHIVLNDIYSSILACSVISDSRFNTDIFIQSIWSDCRQPYCDTILQAYILVYTILLNTTQC